MSARAWITSSFSRELRSPPSPSPSPPQPATKASAATTAPSAIVLFPSLGIRMKCVTLHMGRTAPACSRRSALDLLARALAKLLADLAVARVGALLLDLLGVAGALLGQRGPLGLGPLLRGPCAEEEGLPVVVAVLVTRIQDHRVVAGAREGVRGVLLLARGAVVEAPAIDDIALGVLRVGREAGDQGRRAREAVRVAGDLERPAIPALVAATGADEK